MIKRSTIAGAVALVLSLIVHFFLIVPSFNAEPPPQTAAVSADSVPLGESFDDLVELRAEPIEPEPEQPVEPPEPPEPEQPEPEEIVEPTSEALVASPNPEQTPSPDTGTSPSVEPGVSDPVTAETGETSDADVIEPSGGDETDISDAQITPPVGTDTESVTAEGEPGGTPEPQLPVETATPETTEPETPDTQSVTTPSLDVIAALPPELAQVPDVPQPSAETPQEDTVTSSLRPQARPANLATLGETGGARQQQTLRAPSDIIESPLTAYARDGTNLFAGQRSGQRRGSQGFGGGRGPGNADETNYTGLVLVHLNRIPPVRVSGRGWARVVFRINPDGTLASVDIIDGSGTPEIDRAAKAQVRQGVPFPRPPDGESKLLNFVYRIE